MLTGGQAWPGFAARQLHPDSRQRRSVHGGDWGDGLAPHMSLRPGPGQRIVQRVGSMHGTTIRLRHELDRAMIEARRGREHGTGRALADLPEVVKTAWFSGLTRRMKAAQ